ELDLHFEFREHVAVYGDRLLLRNLGVLIAEYRSDVIRAKVDFVGKLKIARRDAKLVGASALLENFVALSVFDFERYRLIGGRRARRVVKRKRSKMHRLSRLIKRFVGRQKNLRPSFELNRLIRNHGAQYGVGRHAKLPRAKRSGRH